MVRRKKGGGGVVMGNVGGLKPGGGTAFTTHRK